MGRIALTSAAAAILVAACSDPTAGEHSNAVGLRVYFDAVDRSANFVATSG